MGSQLGQLAAFAGDLPQVTVRVLSPPSSAPPRSRRECSPPSSPSELDSLLSWRSLSRTPARAPPSYHRLHHLRRSCRGPRHPPGQASRRPAIGSRHQARRRPGARRAEETDPGRSGLFICTPSRSKSDCGAWMGWSRPIGPDWTAPSETRNESVLTPSLWVGRLPAKTAARSTIFTIFEGTSEIQRMLIGRTVTGLDVR
jgi:hypothetical protein